MYDILSLFSVLYPHLSRTTVRQFSGVVIGLLAMTGPVSMLNISRWTSEGGSYRTLQRFFNTVIPWGSVCWVFFRTYLLDRESLYILAGDATTVSKSGESTYGLSRFFSSTHGKTLPGLGFLSLSLVSVEERRSYPMVMEQIVRGDAGSPSPPASEPRDETQPPSPRRTPGRPKGSRNRNKTTVPLSDTLKHLQTMVKALLARIGDLIPVRYLVLDGYFGHNNALQMTQHCGLFLISKLRVNTALYFPSTEPYPGRGRPRIYGQRFNPQQIHPKHRVSTQTHENITTEVYQATLRHKKFPEPLNVVCILKTQLLTEKKSHVLVFSSDWALDAEKIIDYYSASLSNRVQLPRGQTVLGVRGFYECQQDSRQQCCESVYVHGQCLCETFSTLAFRTRRVKRLRSQSTLPSDEVFARNIKNTSAKTGSYCY